MNVAVKPRMSVAEFLDWAERQPKGRYELVDGQVIAMSPERNQHALLKFDVARVLRSAVAQAEVECTVFPDGPTVVIDEHTSREPDAAIQCDPFDPHSLVLDAPIVVVDVLSPSSARSDTGEKLSEYFSVASIRHYVIVNPFRKLVVHHARSDPGKIETRIIESGEVNLSPPGISVSVAEIFESIPS